MNQQITKTSRILSVYHLFLHCQEISYQEFALNFGVSQRTAGTSACFNRRASWRPDGTGRGRRLFP